MSSELARKAPAELRREVLALRAALAEAEARADGAEAELADERAARAFDTARAEAAASEQAAAHEERFVDMRDFMEGLLKRLKDENTLLRARLDGAADAHEQRSCTELDDFLAVEAASGADADACPDACPSPLKEARMHRLVIVDEPEALDAHGSEGSDEW